MKLDKNKWVTISFTNELIRLAKYNKKIILLDGDLADDADLYNFKKNYPKRFIQNGIAEQDMVSMAGGISLMGLLPVVNSFASFLTARANEQIFNNASEKTKIIYISLYAGLLPAGAGKSHQSTRDISLMSNMPNMKIYHPYNYIEVKKVLNHCIKKEKNNCSIRLSIGPPYKNQPKLEQNYKFVDGCGNFIAKGNGKYSIITYGQLMISQAFKVRELLKKENILIEVINLPSLNYFNKKWFKNTLNKKKKIFILDEHFRTGGFSDIFLSFLNENNFNKNKIIKKIAVDDFPSCGQPDEVLKKHKLDTQNLYKKILRIIRYD
ncbi:transketolase family protein [Candidatus Pelagibacter sp. HIMB1521]|uniref:transketolase family protein n=1 Tax=Candidatus Pelagibacter sp. HIMB1521 TaxID=3413344 RepID=UPI003F86AEEB